MFIIDTLFGKMAILFFKDNRMLIA